MRLRNDQEFTKYYDSLKIITGFGSRRGRRENNLSMEEIRLMYCSEMELAVKELLRTGQGWEIIEYVPRACDLRGRNSSKADGACRLSLPKDNPMRRAVSEDRTYLLEIKVSTKNALLNFPTEHQIMQSARHAEAYRSCGMESSVIQVHYNSGGMKIWLLADSKDERNEEAIMMAKSRGTLYRGMAILLLEEYVMEGRNKVVTHLTNSTSD